MVLISGYKSFVDVSYAIRICPKSKKMYEAKNDSSRNNSIVIQRKIGIHTLNYVIKDRILTYNTPLVPITDNDPLVENEVDNYASKWY